jgi:hypothetical protein
LDPNNFTGVFLGYSATNQNIIYLDLTSGVVKTSHHAQFDEAWYLQPSRPPAAQLLYDLGLEFEDDADDLDIDHESTLQIPVPYPPLAPIITHPDCTTTSSWPPPPASTKLPLHAFPRWTPPPASTRLPLPLRETAAYQPRTAAAAHVLTNTDGPPNPQLFTLYRPNPPQRKNASELVSEFLIGKHNMAMIYLSPNPYFDAFEEIIFIHRFDLSKHRLAGLFLTEHDGRLFLGGISPSTPAAKIPHWRTQIKGAWLIKVGTTVITSIDEVHEAFCQHVISGNNSVTLLFSHPEIRPDISHDGLPIISSAPFH